MRNTTQTTLRIRLAAALSALLLLALPLGASAAGLGKITVLSALGQPLRAEVEISASREELASVSARIASAAAFQQAGIEYSAALAGIRFSIGQRPDGQPILSMLSERPFNEPFLDLLVELTWSSGRLLREYTFLLDPPEARQKTPVAAAAPLALPEVRRETVVTAPVQAVAPAPVQPEMRPVAPVEEKSQKKPQPELQVIRGADGVQRIVKVEPGVKAEPLAAEKSPKETQTRLVKPGDTLGKIAAETKPAGVNLDQMLVALFRGNQEAFVGNVNRLKAGKILNIPDREAVASVSADDAKKTIQAHSSDFNAYSKKLASTVAGASPQKEEAPQRAVSGKIAPKVEEKAPVVASKDKLEVSKSEAVAKAGANRLAAIEETLVSREKALKDANSRIAELEKNLGDLKKLIELKNQSMADLQKQAQAVKPPPPVAPAAKAPAAAPQKPIAKEAEPPAPVAPPPTPPKPAEPAPAAEAAKPAPTLPVPAAPKPALEEKKPAPPTPPPPAPAPEPGFIDESPEIVYGGSAILLLLLGYIGYSRWRKQKAADATDAGEETLITASDSRSGKIEQGEDLLSQTDFSSQPGAAAPNASVDPVAEAEVYLAYGRDVQAEEILVDALKSDPTRLAIPLKLLEIYANRKSVNQFETIARDLHAQTSGAGPDWEKARQLGLQIDPANALYAGPAAAAEFDPDATLVIAPQAEMAPPAELESFDFAAETPPEEKPETEEVAPVEPAGEEPPGEEVPVSLDFDFDLPLAAQISGDADATPAAQDETPGTLDMDLGQDDAGALTNETAPVMPEAASGTLSAPSLDIDFDLDLPASEPPASEPAAPEITKADSGSADAGLDFDFNLGSSEPADSPVPAEPVKDALTAEPAATNEIDFDLELPAPAAKPPADLNLASINLDLDAPLEPAPAPAEDKAAELDDSALQDVATKLELAQAYEEMGDKEGARELLQEVLNEGNAAQQETARNKLAQLG